MTKNKNIYLIPILVFILSLTSCIRQNCFSPEVEHDTERAISLRIVQHGEVAERSRSVDRPICNYEPVAFNTGDVYFVNAATGVIHRHIRITSGNSPLNTSVTPHTVGMNYVLDGGVLLPSVPGQVNRVVIIGNPQVELPTTGNINTVAQMLIADGINNTIASQHNVLSPGVNMWGYNGITLAAVQPAPPALRVYETTVRIAPTIARFELAKIVGQGDIRAFSVCGIFMDNYYRQAHRDGTRPPAAANLRSFGSENSATNFNPGLHDFVTIASHTHTHQNPIVGTAVGNTTVTGGALFTSYNPALIAVPENNRLIARPFGVAEDWTCSVNNTVHTGVRNTWGYQVFTRDFNMNTNSFSGTQPPRMIIRLRDVSVVGIDEDNMINPGTGTNVWYITVRDFRKANGELLSAVGIRASNVYQINELVFRGRDLQPYPNQNPITVEIKIRLAEWDGDDIRPYGFRQPGPTGGPAPGGTFHFQLGAAVNERCTDPVLYRWEQSVASVTSPNPNSSHHWEPVPGAAGTLNVSNIEFTATGITTAGRWFRRVAASCGDVIVSPPARVWRVN